MLTLKGKYLYLRALEPEDLDFLYELENTELFWEVSNTTSPFSKFVLRHYIENSHRDIFEAKQLRLVIVKNNNNQPIGCIDLFDYEPKHKRVGVGIVISKLQERQNGHALEVLQIIISYAFSHLDVHQLYANISADNEKSIALFEKADYKKSALSKIFLWQPN